MRVLVTGGAGFIGSHLCDRLVKQGHDVFCLDNLYTGRLSNVGVAGLRTGDVMDREAVECGPVDRIYHLACPASPKAYQAQPIKTMLVNVVGSHNILNLARKYDARVLLASTSEVYGDPEVHPQTEDYWGNVNPNGPRACYDEGKRAAETLFCDYRRLYGTDIRIARIFNTYGPRMQQDDGRVVSNFICQALRGEPLTIYGDGTQTRSFCYVDDMVDGLITLMESDETRPVNLGNPEEITIGNLARKIISLHGPAISKVEPLPEDDPKQRRPDITRAMNLGWKPETSIDSGLLRTFEWFQSILDEHKKAV